jgi:NAD(P)-dependent dehydrogenase (short-subunit alcohol dehydrogenase family)
MSKPASRSLVAVVTGSTQGLRTGIATALLDRGARVMLSGPMIAEHWRTDLPGDGEKAAAFACDIVDQGQVRALWDVTVSRRGAVDL